MTPVPPAAPDDEELLAAELAFGLLEASERRAAEDRLAGDAAFAAAHARWQDRVAGLFGDVRDAPPPGLWDRIAARLPANDAGSSERALAVRVRRWQLASAAAVVLAIGSTGLLLFRPATRVVVTAAPVTRAGVAPVLRPMIAELASPDRPAAIAVGFDPATGRLTLVPSRLRTGERAAELWVIPADGTPRSLGVVAAAASTRTAPSGLAALIAPGATLAISVEPIGGSPSGKPTGPVILSGTVTAA